MSEEKWCLAPKILNFDLKIVPNCLKLLWFVGFLDLGRGFSSFIFMQSYGMQKHGKYDIA